MSDDQSGGGVEWELRTALDMVFVGRTSGDEDKERLGWIRFSEGLRNVVQSALANQVIPIRVELRIIRDQHKEDEASQAHVNQMIITLEEGVQAEQGKQAARLGIAEAAITTTEHALKDHIEAGRQEDDAR